jgi:hypothetical protein
LSAVADLVRAVHLNIRTIDGLSIHPQYRATFATGWRIDEISSLFPYPNDPAKEPR